MSTEGTTFDPALNSPYNYVPSRTVAIIFVTLFSVSLVIHIWQAARSRLWWLFPTIGIAGALEVAGWSGRLWSSFTPSSFDAFMLQICATILAPTPMVAANFIILSRIINRLGASYSRIPARWYSIIFCTCDFISLVVQGTGGGLAASAETDPTPGGNVMLGGIIFQLVTITIYALFAAEFFTRYFLDRPFRSRQGSVDSWKDQKPPMDVRLKIMSGGLVFSTLCLFIRAVYRTIELSDGWNGRIISTELYFNVLDGAMIVLAIFTMNITHPGVLLHDSERKVTEKKLRDLSLETAHA
ncbi:RTA1 like protein-domain-containing protein [Collybia nuda]|uniref:RTA1 like protein-domain-containing protein n=1 Tax=Collybia nuda TaxID=64659 RepID=A0A9P5XUJ1_9AGAR|nr:RTA1 like protein-domain-containing protein [Collybia nuda]